MVSWLERWAEAMDFDISEYHERRIAQLERDVAALRASNAVSTGTTAQLEQSRGKSHAPA
jgi:hypothetical protein